MIRRNALGFTMRIPWYSPRTRRWDAVGKELKRRHPCVKLLVGGVQTPSHLVVAQGPFELVDDAGPENERDGSIFQPMNQDPTGGTGWMKQRNDKDIGIQNGPDHGLERRRFRAPLRLRERCFASSARTAASPSVSSAERRVSTSRT